MRESDSQTPKFPISVREILFQNELFLTSATISSIAIGLVLLINLLRLGHNPFVFGLDSFIAVIGSILAAGYASRVREHIKNDPLSARTWLVMLIGFGLWGLVEVFRLVSVPIPGQPTFPALNWLWLLGYLPVGYGLYERYLSIETELEPAQRRLMWSAAGLATSIILFTNLLPAIFSTTPGNLSGKIFASLYALFDALLLAVIGRIIFTYHAGFSGPWKFFAIALAAKLIGETVLRFPGQFGISPNGFLNFLLSLANFLHFTWYLPAVFGLFIYEIVLNHREAPEPIQRAKEAAVPNASALLFTDEKDLVIRGSLNFRYLMHLPDEIATAGNPLRMVLGIPESTYAEYKTLLLKQEHVKKFAIEPAHLRKGQKAWITAQASYDPQKKYNGANLVVQVLTEGLAGASLTGEERALVENIFWLTGTEGEDSFKLLIDYFNRNYRMLSTLAIEYEGSRRAAGLSELVNQTSNKQKLQVRVSEQEIMVPDSVKTDELGKAVSVLLAAARTYVSSLAGPEIVRYETSQLHVQLDRSTKNLITRYKLMS